MGYFANSTEGEVFQANNCEKCMNWRHDANAGYGCPVWDAHLLFNYEDKVKSLLNILIERTKDGGNKCRMLLER